MSKVLQDLSASALVNAIEANMYAFTPFSHNWPGAEVHAGHDLSWCITDIPFPWCNVAFRAHLEIEEIDAAIEGLIAKGQAKRVPLQWWVGRDTKPANLGEHLIAHGFTHRGDAPGMAIDLLDIREIGLTPSALTITQVNDIGNLKIWCHVTAIGYGFPEGWAQVLLDWFTRDIDLRQPLKFYLGWLEGKPVATSLLFLAEGVAGIYFVATIPQARRQGAGFAITLKPLQIAREMGYRVGILQASEMGVSVYRRMGFKEYCKIGSYGKPPEV
jgi:GNAT superfamily N-acetyltransferase